MTDAVSARPERRASLKGLTIAGSRERAGDRAFRVLLFLFAVSVIILAVLIGWKLGTGSRMAWSKFGWSFLLSRTWDPVNDQFGALPFLYGTLASSALALLIALPLGVGSAVFLAELAPRRLSNAVTFLIELLAAVPSVILGLIGIFALAPAIRFVEPSLTRWLGFLPLFRGAPYGVGMLAAGVILSVMILPYITIVAREVLLSVPRPLKEGVLALGATRWEMVRTVSLPYAASGIAGAVFLALGRALGETMAVTMVIGNTPKISASLFEPGYTMAAVIANELAEAVSDIHLQSLIAIGFVLFGVTILVNVLARLMLVRLTRRPS